VCGGRSIRVFREAWTKFFAHFGKKSTLRILFQLAQGMANGRGNQKDLSHRLHISPGFGKHGDAFQLSTTSVSFIIEFHSIMFANLFHYRETQDFNSWHLICF